MSKELEKNYNPSEIEDRLYQKWLDKKYFHAETIYYRYATTKYYR